MEKETKAERNAKKPKIDLSSNEGSYTFVCSECGITLRFDETFFKVDPDTKTRNLRFQESRVLFFYCADCLKTIEEKP